VCRNQPLRIIKPHMAPFCPTSSALIRMDYFRLVVLSARTPPRNALTGNQPEILLNKWPRQKSGSSAYQNGAPAFSGNARRHKDPIRGTPNGRPAVRAALRKLGAPVSPQFLTASSRFPERCRLQTPPPRGPRRRIAVNGTGPVR